MKRYVSFLLILLSAALSEAKAESKPPLRSTAGTRPEPTKQSSATNNGPEKSPEPTAPDSNEDKGKGSTRGIEMKNKSSFQMEGDNRNPFWPIGWKPAESVASSTTTEHSGSEIPESAFLVSSITMDKTARFAIVNGKTMEEGQQFGLEIGTQTYQMTVKAIEDGRVILSRRNQTIIVHLRRK